MVKNALPGWTTLFMEASTRMPVHANTRLSGHSTDHITFKVEATHDAHPRRFSEEAAASVTVTSCPNCVAGYKSIRFTITGDEITEVILGWEVRIIYKLNQISTTVIGKQTKRMIRRSRRRRQT